MQWLSLEVWRKHPVQRKKVSKTLICLPYDLDEIYCFYCARYENISFEDFKKLRASDLLRKLKSIPEDEPLFKIIKSRAISLGKIKDKEERRYWRDLKKANKIPAIYLSPEELDNELKEKLGSSKYIGGN